MKPLETFFGYVETHRAAWQSRFIFRGALVSELDLRLRRTIESVLLIIMICLKEHFTWSKDQKYISVQKLKLLVDIKMISSKI